MTGNFVAIRSEMFRTQIRFPRMIENTERVEKLAHAVQEQKQWR